MLRRVPRSALLVWALAVAVLVLLAVAVAAHFGAPTRPGMGGAGGMSAADALTRGTSTSPVRALGGSRLVTRWQLDAVAVAVLVLLAAVYLTGVALVPRRTPGARWPLGRTAMFLAGLAVCGYATNGSIAVYDQVLFSAHMLGHLALIMVAPTLLMLGRPLSLALAATTPRRSARIARIARGRIMSVLTAPPVALAVYAGVIVISHLTGLMNTIMHNAWAGQVEHLAYVLVGCEFFVLVVGAEPIRWRLASPARWLLLAIAMAVDTFTGIVLMQGSTAVSLMPSALHVDALDDTHTGGAIMWFGGDAIMALIMIGLVVQWLHNVDRVPVERGWLEQARDATFAAHTGAHEAADRGIDTDDETAREAYNEWLARLDRH